MAQYKMKAEIKQQWVKALRSGEYEQGRHRLKTPTSSGPMYCCLGVLAEITRDDNVPGRNQACMNNSVLSPEMARHAGLEVISPTAPVEIIVKHVEKDKADSILRHYGEKKEVELWSLNDTYGIKFDQLANIIEEAF